EPEAARLAASRATPAQVSRLRAAAAGMAATGPTGDLGTYLAHDITFHRTLLTASGNALLAGFAPFVAEALTGRTQHHLMPDVPGHAAIVGHVEVAEAIAAGDADRAEVTMRHIVTEAQEAMDEVGAEE